MLECCDLVKAGSCKNLIYEYSSSEDLFAFIHATYLMIGHEGRNQILKNCRGNLGISLFSAL
jgi:hypothetical protein